MKMKFNPIGSTFTEGDVTLQVVEIKDYSTCKGRWYAGRKKGTDMHNWSAGCYSHQHACTAHNRKDRKQVVFTKIETV